jgi:hypothetical protein
VAWPLLQLWMDILLFDGGVSFSDALFCTSKFVLYHRWFETSFILALFMSISYRSGSLNLSFVFMHVTAKLLIDK